MVSGENESIDFNTKVEINFDFVTFSNFHEKLLNNNIKFCQIIQMNFLEKSCLFLHQEPTNCFNALPSDENENIVKWKVGETF